MNLKQKVVLFAALCCLAWTLAQSPWNYKMGEQIITVYRPIWWAPSEGRIDSDTLYAEWLAIGAAGALGLALFSKSKQPTK